MTYVHRDWTSPFEKKSSVYTIGPNFRLASIVGQKFGTVLCGGSVLDGTIGWRMLLVEATKLTDKGGFLHIELARPAPGPTLDAWQCLSPRMIIQETKPLGLDIINYQYTPFRQAYWLQKMDEVFSL